MQPGYCMRMATQRSVFATLLLHTIFWFLMSNICYGTETDLACLEKIQNSLKDPLGSLKYSWNLRNKTEGTICKFNGVECWHPDENRVLNLRLSNMGLEGEFPSGLENCTSMTGLDLSSNSLSGPLPPDISTMIPFVTTLDLSFNNFSGEIPAKLSNCSYLNVIHLRNNRLSGPIPGQLTTLGRLNTLNVADNMLSGPIPAFPQKFAAEYFAGNPGLCGWPRNDCPSSKKIHTAVIVASAMSSVVLIIIVVGIVLLKEIACQEEGKRCGRK